MPRKPRCVHPEIAYHITQRGVDRKPVFFANADRETYLHLVKNNLAETGVRVLGWCLMTNHVHWLVAPSRADSLAVLFRRVHGRYAQYLNARRGRSGHLWQNRYYSCPVAAQREESVLRYIECNPLRAGIVTQPQEYAWSSAAAHLNGPGAERIPLLDWNYWRIHGAGQAWRAMLDQRETFEEVQMLRRATFAGAPFGPAEFVADLEALFDRHWREQGRPKGPAKSEKGRQQSASSSAA